MSSLHSLQRKCRTAFVAGDASGLISEVAGNRVPAAARIAVYANNAREICRKTLLKAYPVIEKLVGPGCFKGLAYRYMREHPSRSGDLQHFGSSFPDFVDRLYGDTEFDYLGDVARLEWAIERALGSPRGTALDLEALGAIEPALYGRIALTTDPSIQLVESRYPVLKIWRANQTEDFMDVDLDVGAERVMVRRNDRDVELRALPEPAFELLRALETGRTLEAVCDELGGAAEFDLGTHLNTLLMHDCLSGFSVLPDA